MILNIQLTFSTPCACLRMQLSLQYIELILDGFPHTIHAEEFVVISEFDDVDDFF